MIADLKRTVDFLSMELGDPKLLDRTLRNPNVRAFIQDTALDLYETEEFERTFTEHIEGHSR